MRTLLATLLLTAIAHTHAADSGAQTDEVWITGEVFTEDHILFFRADKPVKGNPRGAVVLLGAARDSAGVLFPLYLRAAENNAKLRLYGVLQRAGKGITSTKTKLPNVQFITWKVHLPEEPDELPADRKIIIQPGATVPGYKVEAVSSR